MLGEVCKFNLTFSCRFGQEFASVPIMVVFWKFLNDLVWSNFDYIEKCLYWRFIILLNKLKEVLC